MIKYKIFYCIVLIISYLLISGCESKNDIPNNAAVFFEYSIIKNLLGSRYSTANNSSSFDFKSYVEQISEEIQPKLDAIWNIPINSGG